MLEGKLRSLPAIISYKNELFWRTKFTGKEGEMIGYVSDNKEVKYLHRYNSDDIDITFRSVLEMLLEDKEHLYLYTSDMEKYSVKEALGEDKV